MKGTGIIPRNLQNRRYVSRPFRRLRHSHQSQDSLHLRSDQNSCSDPYSNRWGDCDPHQWQDGRNLESGKGRTKNWKEPRESEGIKMSHG